MRLLCPVKCFFNPHVLMGQVSYQMLMAAAVLSGPGAEVQSSGVLTNAALLAVARIKLWCR
jgi:hypothetical protein